MNGLLTFSLRLNAVFSATTGSLLLFGAVPTSEWLGVPMWVSAALGLGLVPFAYVVWQASNRLDPAEVRSIIVADVMWVIASAVLLIGWPHVLSDAGVVATAAVALIVAGLATAQWLGQVSRRALT